MVFQAVEWESLGSVVPFRAGGAGINHETPGLEISADFLLQKNHIGIDLSLSYS